MTTDDDPAELRRAWTAAEADYRNEAEHYWASDDTPPKAIDAANLARLTELSEAAADARFAYFQSFQE